jgi:hypothetical protein
MSIIMDTSIERSKLSIEFCTKHSGGEKMYRR